MIQEGKYCFDHEVIYDLIPRGSSVLDLGCGDGELLKKLIENKGVQGLGVEKDFDRIAGTISRGVPVLQIDLDEGINGLPDHFFDYVILEKTLQAINRPIFVLEEMMRVGRSGIVSFPNFAYWQVISSLLYTGKMPVTDVLPYHWYDTPNIHLFTALDFLDWVRANDLRLERGLSYVNGKIVSFKEDDAYLAEEVLFVISR